MGDANDVMQQYSGRSNTFASSATNFYDHPTVLYQARRSSNKDHMKPRQGTYRPEVDRSQSLSSLAMSVVFDFASSVKSRYLKSPTTATPNLQTDMYVYHKASHDSKGHTQHIPSPPNSSKNSLSQLISVDDRQRQRRYPHYQYQPHLRHQRRQRHQHHQYHRNHYYHHPRQTRQRHQQQSQQQHPAPIKVSTSYRVSQQHTRFLTPYRALPKSSTASMKSSDEYNNACVNREFDEVESTPTRCAPPSKETTIMKSTPVAMTMYELMNMLKEKTERYTYLMDDTEKTMKDLENEIEETLNQLQMLEKEIKEMSLKTAAYTEFQMTMKKHLTSMSMGNNKVKVAERKQQRLNEKIEKWKGERDPMQQLSYILTAHERIQKLDRYTRTFWDIGFYIFLLLFFVVISLFSML